MSRARFAWNRNSLSQVPERSGNYEIRGLLPGDTMYHGETGNLRRRLLQHLIEQDVGFLPAEVLIDLDPNHLSRKKTERERIVRDRPRYNKEHNPDYLRGE